VSVLARPSRAEEATTMTTPTIPTVSRPTPSTAPDVGAAPTASSLRVWLRLYRHHLRLLRKSAIAWTVALAGISVGVVTTYEDRYATPEELQAFADFEGVPAFEALLGRLVQLTTVEGATLSRWGMFSVLAAVWGMLAGARLLRRAEERGHVEFLRAGAVGRRGLLLAALAAIATTHLLFALTIGVTHAGAGMDAGTSWALGGSMALLAFAFALAAALASQLVVSYRRAVGLVGAALGLFLGLRVVAAASATPDWMWWTTPFGWVGFLHPADEAWTTVFAALGLLVVALLALTLTLAERDLGAAWLPDTGDEPRRAPRALGGHTSLAVRETLPGARTWGAVTAVAAVTFGVLARDFSDAVADLPTMVEMGNQLGWTALDTTEGVVAYAMSMVALLLAVFAAGQAAAIREEEASWRIEHLLVRPLGRVRWLVTRIAVSAVAVVVLALASGLAAWLGTAIVGRTAGFGATMGAALNLVPVAWLALGVGIAVIGLRPRWTAPVVYASVLAAYLLDFVGGMLELPEQVLDLSPFRQLAAAPAEAISVAPLVVMVAAGLVLASLGVAGFRRRDLQEA
jgi:ABC-2 type transport system permease protein